MHLVCSVRNEVSRQVRSVVAAQRPVEQRREIAVLELRVRDARYTYEIGAAFRNAQELRHRARERRHLARRLSAIGEVTALAMQRVVGARRPAVRRDRSTDERDQRDQRTHADYDSVATPSTIATVLL